ncbi:class I SAM-dependent methyltransferase [Paenibacillus sp. NEAU-GSW1]|uniref:tRNA (adenine(22)-N(1))-methyltransferase n=1 Tax=Paenibacillus sp. NEAU-GSW1 TaxID=2682486 RepID=UPI0012E2F44B|nr:class I SAM-dependent methyltransferase [Paenibacillus sp. NEAU-GSW1]MUT66691.1 tRNA (adenine-N(1))-methyltransferase [Paenibacillus sp. NEAU-GSW1]
MLKISKRLQTIADFVTPDGRAADIGSDHAMLPVYLLQTRRVASAIAGELNQGPYEAACKQAADAGLTYKLSVRRGDGLSVLQPGETDTITIAGMGGALMSEILEAGFQTGKLEGVSELVLQPNVGEDLVRSWLLKRGWYLQAEAILEEDGKIYEVLHAIKLKAEEGNDSLKTLQLKLYDSSFLPISLNADQGKALLLQMGPHLLRQPSEVLAEKWRLELDKLEKICAQLSLSDQPQAEEKKAAFREQINKIEEVLRCLPMDKPSFN